MKFLSKKYLQILIICCIISINHLFAHNDKLYIDSLINIGKYNQALRELDKYPDLFFLKGKCYLHMLNYKKALFYFLKAETEENISLNELYFYIGLCYYKLQDFQNAIKYLEYTKKTEQVYFFLGLSHFYIGNYNLATKYFKKIKGKFKNQANYFKALCAIELNKRKKAITILKEILKNNPAPYLKNQITNELNKYQNKFFSFLFYDGLTFDSNVLREPESSTSESSDKSDMFNELFLNMNVNLPITEEFKFKPELSFYQSIYKDLSEFNLTGYNLGAGVEILNENLYLYLKPYYEYFELDNKNYQKNYKILSEVFFNNFGKNYLNIKLLLGKKNFFKYNFKDCNFVNIDLNQYIKFEDNYYRIGISFGKENSKSNMYSFKSIGVSEGFLIQLINNFELKNDIYFTYRDFDSKWEKNFKFILNLAFVKYKFFKIGANFKYINNSSNKDNFDYTSTQSTIYVSFYY